jgi:glycine cleavage system transcriptional repressor
MTLVVSVPGDADSVRAELAPVGERLGLLISVREVNAEHPAPGGEAYVVSVHGADRPGIVHRVAIAIAGAGGNITDLSTRLAGELYVLVAEVDLPGAPEPLAEALATLAVELGVDAHLNPADADPSCARRIRCFPGRLPRSIRTTPRSSPLPWTS